MTSPNTDAIIKAMNALRTRRNHIIRDYVAESDLEAHTLAFADEVRGHVELFELGISHDESSSAVLAEVGAHYWQGKPELRKLFVANLRSIIDAVERNA